MNSSTEKDRVLIRYLFRLFLPWILGGSVHAALVRPVDNGRALVNPGMGWSYNFRANAPAKWCETDDRNSDTLRDGTLLRAMTLDSACLGSDRLDAFPGASSAMIRLGWNYFERRKGDTTWERIENVRKRWSQNGKRISFSFVACDPSQYLKTLRKGKLVPDSATPNSPRWVMGKAKGWYMYVRPDHVDGPILTAVTVPNDTLPYYWSWCPEYDDPYFLEQLESFIQKAASKYAANPDVEFIEIGSIGTWGEGHDYQTGRADVPITASMKLKHLRLWKKYFPDKTIFVSDAFARSRSDKGNLASDSAVLDSARLMGIGIADHSLLVHQDSAEYYLSVHLAGKFNDSLPVLLEPDNGKPLTLGMVKAVRDYKASYVRINNSYKKILKETGGIVDSINRILGYRFQIREAGWTSVSKPGSSLKVEIKIANAGVARCYRGGFLSVHLVDGDSVIVASAVDLGLDVKNLTPGSGVKGAPEYLRTLNLPLPTKRRSGKLAVYVSIGGKNGEPIYGLPYAKSGIPLLYELGGVTIGQ